jgi:para-aminobenzoate synthetase/4-amino-4-deoxychorismate lyase
LDDWERGRGACRLFRAPRCIVAAWSPDEVAAALVEIERARSAGLWAAGYLAYELGYLQEPRLAPLLPPDRDTPLLWMGLFSEPESLDAPSARRWLPPPDIEISLSNLRTSMDRAAYKQAFDQAHALIVAGDVYQINLTFKLTFTYRGDPRALYTALRRRQRVGHGALIGAPGFHVLSLSPEMFLSVRDGKAVARPMKGTATRGATAHADAVIRARLQADEKSRAENLMIVDLLRNDLSRLARRGDVCVTGLFNIETYRTLHQMTSEIQATIRRDVSLTEVLAALFPCGSVTGAPKIRAMEIIRALEPLPRGVYCGAIGYLAPNGDASFNVAIRTILLRSDGRGELGIGSGVVFDSEADAEYQECLLKASFLTQPEPPLALVETLRWQRDGGYVLLERHLERLAASAAWFALPCDGSMVRTALSHAAGSFSTWPMRVRLLLDEDGEVTISSEALPDPGNGPLLSPLRWRFATRPMSSDDPFLYHKTTRRPLYDDELARARADGFDEVLFRNRSGELTEGAWSNLFVRRAGRLLTPPVRCGLLDGTLRQELLATGAAEEAVLRPEDLVCAEEVLFGNSVRGLMPAIAPSL